MSQSFRYLQLRCSVGCDIKLCFVRLLMTVKLTFRLWLGGFTCAGVPCLQYTALTYFSCLQSGRYLCILPSQLHVLTGQLEPRELIKLCSAFYPAYISVVNLLQSLHFRNTLNAKRRKFFWIVVSSFLFSGPNSIITHYVARKVCGDILLGVDPPVCIPSSHRDFYRVSSR